MNEIDREEILAQRQDEQNQIKVKHQLDQMVKDQSGRKDEGATRGTKRMTRILSPFPALLSDGRFKLGRDLMRIRLLF